MAFLNRLARVLKTAVDGARIELGDFGGDLGGQILLYTGSLLELNPASIVAQVFGDNPGNTRGYLTLQSPNEGGLGPVTVDLVSGLADGSDHPGMNVSHNLRTAGLQLTGSVGSLIQGLAFGDTGSISITGGAGTTSIPHGMGSTPDFILLCETFPSHPFKAWGPNPASKNNSTFDIVWRNVTTDAVAPNGSVVRAYWLAAQLGTQ